MRSKKDQFHDRYFKDLMQDIDLAKEFLMIHIDSDIHKHIDWDTLELYDISLIGNRKQQLYTDLAYKARTKKELTEVFFIINHERKADNLLPIKSLEYMLGTLKKIIKQKGNPSFIIHTTLYNGGKTPYPYAKSILDYFKEKDLAQQMLIKSGQVINIADLDDALLASHQKIGILELFMKHADNPNLLKWIEEHPDVAKELAENKYINRSLEYVADVGYHKIEDLIKTFEKVSEKLGETMLTTAQQIEKKGIKQGIKQGMKKGVKQGIHARNIELAKIMLNDGEPIDKISKWTDLTRSAIEELKNS